MPKEAQYNLNLNYLSVLGPLRVESVTPHDLDGARVRVCILMGPTGSGKSAFIEALAPDQGLSISGDSIESITQNVVFYQVENLQDTELPVIFMDTPGLLDPRISESRVVAMISKELDTLRASAEMAVVTLCYFHPINVARVGGTKRGAVEFLQGFAQTFNAHNVNVVTTMWNTLWNDKQITDAEQRFNALQVEIYKGLPSLNVTLDRFKSTAASALSILDSCRHGWYHTTTKQRISLPTFDNMVLQGLVERIRNIQQYLDDLADDDHQLPAICEAEHKTARLLYDFCCDLYDCAPDAYRAIFPDAQCPPTTFDCQPLLSELICYRSMSPLQTQPASMVAASVDPLVPGHSTSTKPRVPLMGKLLRWRVKRFGMFEVHDRDGIQAVTQPMQRAQVGDSQVLNVDPHRAALDSEWNNLTVTGEILVELVGAEIPKNAKIYVLMGPVGSGKTCFVESLAAGEQRLNISKDQLEGYTRTVNAYHVVNVLNGGCPIILLDTPGLSDSVGAEIEVMSMVAVWMERNGIHFFHEILFLTPITQTRLPGSGQRTLAILKDLLTAMHDLDSVLVITTMWDTLHNERTRSRGESNYTHASSDRYKDFIDGGADITRFMNTKASALVILDRPLHKKRVFDVVGFTTTPHLYQDLYRRIEGAMQKKHIIEEQLSQPEAKTNADLKSTLENNLLENEQEMGKFIEKFIEYGNPPAQFADDHQRKCELVLSVRPELRHRLSPSSATSSDNTRSKATQDLPNGIPHSMVHSTTDTSQVLGTRKDQHKAPSATGGSRILGIAKDRIKRLPGFKH